MCRSRLAAPLLVALFMMMLAVAPPAEAATCDRVAANGGDDAAEGTVSAPFATVQRLADSLAAGQTGCIRAGDYPGDVKVTSPGITLTGYAGERGRIIGRLWIAAGADGVTVSGLDLDGRTSPLPSPLILANGVTFRANDVTNPSGICFNLGAATWSPVVTVTGVVIDGNRIHNCGRLPATNHDHGIYVENTRDAQILNNAIFDNADRAINLYPNAQGTVIRGNVMDGNGEGVLFSGDLGKASSGTVLEGNVMTYPKLRASVESWYPDGNPKGTLNVVRNNCVFGGAGLIDSSGGGFTVSSDNRFLDPLYVDRQGKDFRLTSGSPCADLVGAIGAGTTTTTTPRKKRGHSAKLRTLRKLRARPTAFAPFVRR